jgi:hypothetical protein
LAAAGTSWDDDTITAGTGWTQQYSQYTLFQKLQTQIRTGSTSTTVGWNSLTAQYTQELAAIEVKEAAAAGGGTTRLIGTSLTLGRQLHRPGLVRNRHASIIRPRLILPRKAA